ncbi:hypothetical protein ACQUQP_19560 [Marinobacterium sp. YM272]|uniref:hypothetical protein n=1 Tax=Marinobacterium sp. YM272 TaxID=3421654 RepID=UPI003D7F3FD2
MQSQSRLLPLITPLLFALVVMLVALSAEAGVNEDRGVASPAIIVDSCITDPALGQLGDSDHNPAMPASPLPAVSNGQLLETPVGRAYPPSEFSLLPRSRAPPVVF